MNLGIGITARPVAFSRQLAVTLVWRLNAATPLAGQVNSVNSGQLIFEPLGHWDAAWLSITCSDTATPSDSYIFYLGIGAFKRVDSRTRRQTDHRLRWVDKNKMGHDQNWVWEAAILFLFTGGPFTYIELWAWISNYMLIKGWNMILGSKYWSPWTSYQAIFNGGLVKTPMGLGC